MGLKNEIAEITKLVREALLLEVLKEFPDVTEEELIFTLECWKMLREKTDEQLRIYSQNGRWRRGCHLDSNQGIEQINRESCGIWRHRLRKQRMWNSTQSFTFVKQLRSTPIQARNW